MPPKKKRPTVHKLMTGKGHLQDGAVSLLYHFLVTEAQEVSWVAARCNLTRSTVYKYQKLWKELKEEPRFGVKKIKAERGTPLKVNIRRGWVHNLVC
jgi:hypothetical protein